MGYQKTTDNLAMMYMEHCNMINGSKTLQESIAKSVDGGVYYSPDVSSNISDIKPMERERGGIIELIDCGTIRAGIDLSFEYEGKKIALLNFASAKNPGGFVEGGSIAQEEAICRSSTLKQVLVNNKFKDFYKLYKNTVNFHPYYTDAVIYTPNITITCSDDDIVPVLMDEKDWVNCDVITCAAPNLRTEWDKGIDMGIDSIEYKNFKDKIYQCLVSRVRAIIKSAIVNDVDILVLGAFGCGVFRNDPTMVANAFCDVLTKKLTSRYRFDRVVFAIMDDKRGNDNFGKFRNVLNKNFS